MEATALYVLILGVLIGGWCLDLLGAWLNHRTATWEVPGEFRDVYPPDRYLLSQEYLKVRIRLGVLKSTLGTEALIGMLLLGGFGLMDQGVRSFGFGQVATGVLYAGILFLGAQLLSLPFSIYSTFVIEERFGFNRTTVRTFVLDQAKGLVLAVILGGTLMVAVLWCFEELGPWAFPVTWGGVTLFGLGMAFVAPALIMPWFLKFTPLPEGYLRAAIEGYARSQRFAMRGVFSIDGSRRSTKANAFFTGFGRTRRIALYDTLIQKHPPEEIVAILAHEVGHFRRHHVWKGVAASILSTGLFLGLATLAVARPEPAQALGMQPSVFAALTGFAFLYAPLGLVLSAVQNSLSRRHESEADTFAARTTGKPGDLASALKRLSADALSNLTPHPLLVFLYHSHPPVLQRVRTLLGLSA